MKIAEGINESLYVCDIEVLHDIIDIGCYDPDKKEWIEFEMSRRKNDINRFINFYTSNKYKYFVGFNNIDYDQNMLQYILKNHDGWYDLTGAEIAALVRRYNDKHIDNRKYKIPARWKESDFPITPLDLYTIHHFDNDAKRTSLKWCAFMMNMSVEEMPIEHYRKDLSDNELDMVISYRRNDVKVTEGLLDITLGQVHDDLPELSDYKGKNKIQDRFDVMKETGLICLNWSDVKIGEEWNKLDYMKALNISEEKALFSKDIKYPYGKKFKKYFPKTMEFQTKLLKNFTKSLGEEYVKNQKQEFPITINKTTYTIAKGGIHSTEKNREVIPPPGFICRDADVGSQYPNSIVKLEIYAPHLDKLILEQYQGKIKLRITYKTKAGELKKQNMLVEARIFQSVQEMLKLCLNGGYYGKLGQPGSFLEFPEGLLKVCMSNQIEILMAIEAMEMKGFQVISGNTDGFVTMFPKEKEQEYNEVCEWWEKKVGNFELGKLEYADYIGLWQRNINHYIAKYTDGKVKKKGSFVTSVELHKNKSKRIIPLALEAYFIDGKDPIEFIRNHKRIWDFCAAVKATGKMHYEEQWEEDGKIVIKKHKKLVRYYITTEGTVLYKRGFNHEGKPMDNHCEATDDKFPMLGQPLVQYFNEPFFVDKFEDYKVNYNYYIIETLQIIDDIQKTKKAQKFHESLKPVQQISMFGF